MLEVEDWTQQPQAQAPKRRGYPRRVASPPMETETKAVIVEDPLPIPAEPEVEEPFTAPRPFPARSRADSISAGPSSLSRLLAQASTEVTQDPMTTPLPETAQPFLGVKIDDKEPQGEPQEEQEREEQEQEEQEQPEAIDAAFPSPPPITVSTHSSPQPQSPMRPGSRSSKVSITSRMSIGRKPGVSSKASPTTAVTGLPITAGKVPGDFATTRRNGEIPTPEGSPSDGMSNLLKQHHRRRTASSYSVTRTFPLTVGTTTAVSHATNVQGSTEVGNETSASGAGGRLASLATSWGVTFGRRRKTVVLDSIPQVSTNSNSDDQPEGSGNS
jgi:autophagy-related protein 11